MNLRPAQEAILEYENGRLAISAVPGSGKTFTLSLLAAQLIGDGRIQPDSQQILIVTYLNASVDTFKARIRKRLTELELSTERGFDVRTLHSLALEIVRQANGGDSEATAVLDDVQSSHYLALSVDQWIEDNREQWLQFLDDASPQKQARWRDITSRTARTFIRVAKNERYRPEEILQRSMGAGGQGGRGAEENSPLLPGSPAPLLSMLAGIYGRYQTLLTRQAALDFDDLIWQAVDLLEQRPDLAAQLRQRWPYVLEDEAQDSVPLQEILLETLTGEAANWVRVGDPNQAITSTFTAAHPRFFNAFSDRRDVLSLPLPNSGRCAPLIMGAANTLLDWVIDKHPVPEVRRHTFRRQAILPTPPGDAQPNPPDSEAAVRIKVYKHREDEELPAIAQLAAKYARERADHTLAILVPTNQIGYDLAERLDDLEISYDNLLRGGGREREIAAAMYAILAVLADPLDTRAIVAAHASLHELGHPAATGPVENLDRFHTVLRSVYQPEALLFPWDEAQWQAALPAGVLPEDDWPHVARLCDFLRRMFALRELPIDDLALTLGDELFAWSQDVHETDLAIAYQIATLMRGWRDMQPHWRLPELAAELADVADGRRRLPITTPADLGYEPEPGRITLTTQHSAKGLEWDAVFLVGIDGFWIPGSLDAPFLGVHDFLGGDPTAEAAAQLRYLMAGESGLYTGRTATESAHIDIISERLRLLYVGVTRARRYLHLSRSRATRQYNKEREAEPATVLGVLYQYLKSREA
ncbi:MAG: ATP-dependent helicase [Ardenticatenaceae bacterium]|nr:ATP-dependent helicase [Ardenticatenaceae bacterium]MCB8989636.1 ATP-dependent helicase [Ardenticatenaceae bacterium]MCB9002906.1 ATP-dependent helicase [Ardenticatenaceae bacterium]